ncbi:MAG: autotransporter-associated beta strand repeat-containing protein, partial [Planctomycetes bacterium]|nr:autotransporter-associated beta strand repeat-containing protein [Planctomycetota bacterium]
MSGWDGATLTKRGAGTLVLAAANTYTGSTLVQAGTLAAGIANAFADSSSVSVSSGATLALDGYDQLAQNLTGAGAITLGDATLTVANTAATEFSGEISGAGAVALTGGQLTLSGTNTYAGGTDVQGGILVATTGASLGTGGAAIAAGAELQLAITGEETFATTFSGDGTLAKTGAGTAILTAAGSVVGAVDLRTGTLSFQQDGAFQAASYTTAGGTTTALGGEASLALSGAYTQAAGSTLEICIGNNEPAITAATATIAGTLDVTGFEGGMYSSATEAEANRYVVIQTTGGVSGSFSTVQIGTTADPVDYLVVTGSNDGNAYTVGFQLAWTAGAADGNGSFTIAAGDTFDVDVVLADQTGSFVSLWDGESLTKNGDGTLILSRENTYTGTTTITAGTLRTGVADAFADSASVTVAAGATLDLDGYDQTAADLAGAGDVTLG